MRNLLILTVAALALTACGGKKDRLSGRGPDELAIARGAERTAAANSSTVAGWSVVLIRAR